jgi:hypothetical protein
MVAWARAAGKGPTRLCRRKAPRGDFLREKREILWANGGFPVRWQAHLARRPQLC